ncbi:MAG: hypothetical protein AAFV80_11355 [Bacteroidota bacterium]
METNNPQTPKAAPPSRRNVFNSNTVIAISALVVSLCALIVSVLEVRYMRSQQKATLWPYVQVGLTYNSEGFGIRASNMGTGPAVIDGLEVWKGNRYYAGIDDMINDLLPEGHQVTYSIYKTSSFNGTVLPAEQERLIFSVPWNAETRILSQQMMGVQFQVRYCSVLDDCWLTNSDGEDYEDPAPFDPKREFNQ